MEMFPVSDDFMSTNRQKAPEVSSGLNFTFLSSSHIHFLLTYCMHLQLEEVFQVDYVDLRLSHIFAHVQCGHTASLRATIWSILAGGIKICFEWIYTWLGVITLQSVNWRILQVLRKKQHWANCTGRKLSVTVVDGIEEIIHPILTCSWSLILCFMWQVCALMAQTVPSLIASCSTLEATVTHYHLSWIILHYRKQQAAAHWLTYTK